MPRESALKRKVLKFLRERGIKAIATTGVSEAGTPDIIACHCGRMVLIELKVPGKDARPLQVHRMEEWRACGAVVGVVHSIEELIDLLASIPAF